MVNLGGASTTTSTPSPPGQLHQFLQGIFFRVGTTGSECTPSTQRDAPCDPELIVVGSTSPPFVLAGEVHSMNFHRSEPTEIPLALTAGRVGQAHLRHGSTGEGPTTWDIRHLAKGVIERTYACGSVTGNTDPLDRRRSTARRNDASLQERHRRQFTSLTEVTEAEVGNVVTVPR